MKYKILKGTELFKKLADLRKRMNEVQKQAKDLAIELGGTAAATSGRNLAGGIDAVEFDKKPDGWRSVGNSWQNLYYPKADKKNKEIHDKINALPILKFEELNNAVGFSANQSVCNSNGFAFIKTVGMQWHKDFILMETAEGTKYTPVDGVQEILGSEFEELSKKIKE